MSDILDSVGCRLRDVRIKAGLTQEQVAERMHTKQTAIARIEADKRGSISLCRIADYAIACGVVPLSLIDNGPMTLNFIPLEDAREFILAHPQDELTWKSYIHWKAWKDVEPPQQPTLSCYRVMAA